MEGEVTSVGVLATPAGTVWAGKGGGDKREQPRRRSATAPAGSLANVFSDSTVERLLSASLLGQEMDALALAVATHQKPLSTLGCRIFQHLGLQERFGIDESKVAHYFTEIELGYEDTNPYHNSAHAASVLHMMHGHLNQGGVLEVAVRALGGGCGNLERMAGLLAAAVHDFEHLAVTNDFLVKTFHERALRYNDKHVNEHHHAAASFAVLGRQQCNFLAHLPIVDYRRLRGLIVDLVLATDMSENTRIIKAFGEAFDMGLAPSPSPEAVVGAAPVVAAPGISAEGGLLLLKMAIKCADIGHLALTWNPHLEWVKRLEMEFFAQGDREKALGISPISFLMDRDKPGVSQTQTGFFDFVALPLFKGLAHGAPLTASSLAIVEANCKNWRDLERTSTEGEDA